MPQSIIHILEYYILFQIILQANLSAITIFFIRLTRKLCKQWYFAQNFSNYNNMKRIFTTLLTLILSAIVGLINGFFGGGGGMLCVPMLQKIRGLKTKKAHATAIMIILPITLLSALTYWREGAIPEQHLPLVIVGTLLGGIVGAVALKKLSPVVVGAIFAVMMIAVGVRLAV